MRYEQLAAAMQKNDILDHFILMATLLEFVMECTEANRERATDTLKLNGVEVPSFDGVFVGERARHFLGEGVRLCIIFFWLCRSHHTVEGYWFVLRGRLEILERLFDGTGNMGTVGYLAVVQCGASLR